MNRRTLIKSLPVLLAIPFVRTNVTGCEDSREAELPSTWCTERATQITAENGQMWLASRSRLYGQNPILVAFDDDIAVEIKSDHVPGASLSEAISASAPGLKTVGCRTGTSVW